MGVGFGVDPSNSLLITLALRVFSGVYQAVREFLEIRLPKKLMFSKGNEDLGLLYEVYLTKEHTTLHQMGYRIEELTNVSALWEFTVMRSGFSEWKK